MNVATLPRPTAATITILRDEVACMQASHGEALPFGIAELDDRLVGHGLDRAGLHEAAAASTTLGDDAATTLFLAGIAARFAARSDRTVLWALTRFDLYAPGLEQVGLGPDRIFYALGRKDKEVLALAEDGLRSKALACVIAEVKCADRTATRRLQLAAADGETPMLLFRRHRSADRCPLEIPSSAMTRWRIGCLPSRRLKTPGVGRGLWSVELVRQRNGNPFTFELEACDDTGRLALSSPVPDRAAAATGASRAA